MNYNHNEYEDETFIIIVSSFASDLGRRPGEV